jgi:hypothetical protein
MKRLAKQTSIAAADDGQEKGLHFSKDIWQRRRKRSIIMIEPPITFLPSVSPLTSKLLAKVFTNEWMRIEMSRIVWIFSREESCSS